MKVKLKRPAFIGGSLFKPDNGPVEISDEFKDQLPKDAVILNGTQPVAAKPVAKPSDLKDFDIARAGAEGIAAKAARK